MIIIMSSLFDVLCQCEFRDSEKCCECVKMVFVGTDMSWHWSLQTHGVNQATAAQWPWTHYQGSSLIPQLAIWRTRLSGPFLYLAPRNGGLRWRKTIDCTPEIHFRIKIDDLTNLPNGNLSDILQATRLYAFSTSGFFCFNLYWYYIEGVN